MRGRASSGDIDCLLSHPSYNTRDAAIPDWLASLVEAPKASGFITDVISLGRKKCHAVCRLLPPPPAGECVIRTQSAYLFARHAWPPPGASSYTTSRRSESLQKEER